MAKDRTWAAKVRKGSVGKFCAAPTLATKNAKRKKVTEILDRVGQHGRRTSPLDT